MVDKFVARDATTGLMTHYTAVVVGGVGNAGKIAALDVNGRWDASMMPVGIVADSQLANSAEALTAGDYCYLNGSGEIARASAAAGGNPATGFVLASSNIGEQNRIYFEGRNTSHTGLTVGVRYYLSDTTPGGVRSTPVPDAAGKLHQQIGTSVSATEMNTQLTSDVLVLSA